MQKLLLFILITFFLIHKIEASSLADTLKKKDPNTEARSNINLLKDGYLLVRLHTRQATIDALQKNGNKKEAELLERHQHQENMLIATAFKTNFTFCPVYFFFNTESSKINSVDLELMDANLQSVKLPENLKNKTFLVAEIGPLYEQVYQDGSNKRDNVNNREVFKKAIIILDKEFNYIRKPFPYYVKVPDLTKLNKRIKLLDKKLYSFYKPN